jgi:hypothetical protein
MTHHIDLEASRNRDYSDKFQLCRVKFSAAGGLLGFDLGHAEHQQGTLKRSIHWENRHRSACNCRFEQESGQALPRSVNRGSDACWEWPGSDLCALLMMFFFAALVCFFLLLLALFFVFPGARQAFFFTFLLAFMDLLLVFLLALPARLLF